MSAAATYDYIVVGFGSAGAVLANRLSASGQYTVLCLEAGTENSNYFWSKVPIGMAKLIDNPAVNWVYESEPDAGSGGRKIPVIGIIKLGRIQYVIRIHVFLLHCFCPVVVEIKFRFPVALHTLIIFLHIIGSLLP